MLCPVGLNRYRGQEVSGQHDPADHTIPVQAPATLIQCSDKLLVIDGGRLGPGPAKVVVVERPDAGTGVPATNAALGDPICPNGMIVLSLRYFCFKVLAD